MLYTRSVSSNAIQQTYRVCYDGKTRSGAAKESTSMPTVDDIRLGQLADQVGGYVVL